MLIVLVARAYAADFSAGVEAYARGDYEVAFEQWQSLARQGDSRAQYRLAQMFADGVGVREDDRAALHWYRQAAEQGSVEARSELALRYSLGRGVRQDHSRAAHWYGLLAEDGHVNAQYLLAGMYKQGRGVAMDLPRAVYWYRRAAEGGHAGAQVKLGEMYLHGHGVEEDLVQAWGWFDLAAARGHDVAAMERAMLRLRLGEEELAQAMRLSRAFRPPAARSRTSSSLPARARWFESNRGALRWAALRAKSGATTTSPGIPCASRHSPFLATR
jgi:TPR repeat protein